MGRDADTSPCQQPGESRERFASKSSIRFMQVTSFGIVVITLVRLALAYTRGFETPFVSGAWFSLTEDLANGVFYRALADGDLAFGGTRYFPLTIFALLGLQGLVGNIMAAGVLFALLAAALLVAGCALLLHELKVQRSVVLPLALLPLLTSSSQVCIDTVRSDLLAAALGTIGLALSVRWLNRGSSLASLGALILGLAFATKLTAISGAVGAIAVLPGLPKKLAIRYAGALGLAFTLVLLVLYFGSSGRFFQNSALVSDGGMSVGSLAKAPLRIFNVLINADLALVLLAVVSIPLIIAHRRHLPLPVLLALVASIVMLVPVFASPRVWINHFTEVQVWLVCLLGVVLSRTSGDSAQSIRLTIGILCLVGLMSLIGHIERVDWRRTTSVSQEQVVTVIRSVNGPILSEDPMIPLLAGRFVNIPEPYMLRVAIPRSPDVAAQVSKALSGRRYGAIVFLKDPLTTGSWYDENHFGRWFIQEALRYYSLSEVRGSYHVYLPK